ncbi:hypothetical protein BDZ91DRAFT_853200 [Kalaharituber pfeilii]|nr:hypothetical protein BDZ91DRAFT_853200 [Kalaharituber pfeilii]
MDEDSTHNKIIKEILEYENLDTEFPGLREVVKLLTPALSERPTPTDGLLDRNYKGWVEKVIRNAIKLVEYTPEFKNARAQLDEATREKLDQFLNGKSIAEVLHATKAEDEYYRDAATPIGAPALEHFKKLSERLELVQLDDTQLQAATNVEFHNWGLTVKNTPAKTFVVKTVDEVIKIVTDAKENKQRVRAAGYRHTWGDMFSQDNEVLISMLDIETVTKLPDFASIEKDPDYSGNEFKKIEMKEDLGNPSLAFLTVGAAVTNEDFRRWALTAGKGNSEWTLPINVIMVEITFGGSNAPICHGAGLRSHTLSDLVTEIQYVNAKGEHKSTNFMDPELLKAAAGCFGLLGIVTFITFKVDRMTYALLDPKRIDLLLAIPPPQSYIDDRKLPTDLQNRLDKKYSKDAIQGATKAFIDAAEKNYYAEWFWFPYQDDAFVNCWDNTLDPKDAINYPGRLETFLQWLFNWGGGVLNDTWFFRKFPPKWQATIIGTLAMATMPRNKVKTQLINALHFRRGVQNMRVGDFELNIPIPAKEKSNVPSKSKSHNWELVQQAWWDAIIAMYDDMKHCSARIALEMRVTGDSAIIMAPQYGNTLGTASIEVITSMPAVEDPGKIWPNFKQRLANTWLEYRDADGELLNSRPHLAKEWLGTKAHGQDWVDYLRQNSYEGRIPEFRAALEKIWDREGVPDDLQKMFSNPLFDKLIFAK